MKTIDTYVPVRMNLFANNLEEYSINLLIACKHCLKSKYLIEFTK